MCETICYMINLDKSNREFLMNNGLEVFIKYKVKEEKYYLVFVALQTMILPLEPLTLEYYTKKKFDSPNEEIANSFISLLSQGLIDELMFRNLREITLLNNIRKNNDKKNNQNI